MVLFLLIFLLAVLPELEHEYTHDFMYRACLTAFSRFPGVLANLGYLLLARRFVAAATARRMPYMSSRRKLDELAPIKVLTNA